MDTPLSSITFNNKSLIDVIERKASHENSGDVPSNYPLDCLRVLRRYRSQERRVAADRLVVSGYVSVGDHPQHHTEVSPPQRLLELAIPRNLPALFAMNEVITYVAATGRVDAGASSFALPSLRSAVYPLRVATEHVCDVLAND